jgi:hypothetical protein
MREQKLIDDIIENFDFSRVEKTMELLDWKYAGYDETPKVGKLVLNTLERIREAIKGAKIHKSDFFSYSGGLKASATYDVDKQEVDSLNLSFIVTDWDAYFDEL